MPIKQIITASGWYFVHGNDDGKVTAYPLAAWAHNDDGKVVGMISVKGGGNNSAIGDVCRLVIVPPVTGVYKHHEEMLPHEMESVRQGVPIDVPSGVCSPEPEPDFFGNDQFREPGIKIINP